MIEPRYWTVTLIVSTADGPREVEVTVEARSREAARSAAKALHPDGHTVHIERAEVPA